MDVRRMFLIGSNLFHCLIIDRCLFCVSALCIPFVVLIIIP